MAFNSWQYFIFLPVVFLLYWVLPQRFRWVLLLIASYYAYMSWNPYLVILILFTTLTSYLAALGIGRYANRPKLKKAILVLGVAVSLVFLFFFKYFNFLSENVTALLRAFSLPVGDFTLNVMLPVGISFYTFQTLSYVIDVYRGDMPATRHFGIYALYVSFFPQLVAGPIERAVNLLPQFYEKHTFSTAQTSEGLRMLLLGFFKKVVVADFVAVYVNNVYNNLENYGGLSLIAATLLFAIQIYCDFSGYSDIAIGSAKLLGFRLMENFRSPYLSCSVQEFWRRWHISLSTWFSDYVYIPLGGSRVGRGRQLFNLMVTFVLSGLWHGAAWNFLLWGALHGVCLCVDVFLRPWRQGTLQNRKTKPGRWAVSVCWWLATMAVVMFGWMLFRANSLQDIGYIITHLANGLNPLRIMEYLAPMGITPLALVRIVAMVGVLALWDGLNLSGQGLEKFQRAKPAVRYITYYLLALAIILCFITVPSGETVEFIYFQF